MLIDLNNLINQLNYWISQNVSTPFKGSLFCSNIGLRYSYFPAENLIEYKWPPDETGEYYMLQEQVSEYLGVTSFKRKYPGIYF